MLARSLPEKAVEECDDGHSIATRDCSIEQLLPETAAVHLARATIPTPRSTSRHAIISLPRARQLCRS